MLGVIRWMCLDAGITPPDPSDSEALELVALCAVDAFSDIEQKGDPVIADCLRYVRFVLLHSAAAKGVYGLVAMLHRLFSNALDRELGGAPVSVENIRTSVAAASYLHIVVTAYAPLAKKDALLRHVTLALADVRDALLLPEACAEQDARVAVWYMMRRFGAWRPGLQTYEEVWAHLQACGALLQNGSVACGVAVGIVRDQVAKERAFAQAASAPPNVCGA